MFGLCEDDMQSCAVCKLGLNQARIGLTDAPLNSETPPPSSELEAGFQPMHHTISTPKVNVRLYVGLVLYKSQHKIQRWRMYCIHPKYQNVSCLHVRRESNTCLDPNSSFPTPPPLETSPLIST